MKSTIEHHGIIEKIDARKASVRIKRSAACATCSAQSSCGMKSEEEQIVEVELAGRSVHIGEEVIVTLRMSLGLHALFLGHMLPFLIIIVSLTIGLWITNNELLVGLTSIGLLIPYYVSLYLVRDKLFSKYIFQLK